MNEWSITRSLAMNRKRSGAIIGVRGCRLGAMIRIQPDVEIILGRSPQSDIQFDDAKISRKHCGIVYSVISDSYSVYDYSKNGVFLEDGKRLPEGWNTGLLPGTALCLGTEGNMIRLG